MVKKIVSKDPDLEEDQIICRYMDLPKFIDLLRTNELHLENASNFDDPLEGTMPESIRKSYNEIPDEENKNPKSIEEQEFEYKLRTNISCWTLGSEDNMALCKIYGGSAQSLSISTTVGNVISSALKWCEEGEIIIKKSVI
jgi:hypothetical protein